MLRLLSLLALLLAAVPAQEAVPLKIGTWNLEFLGADPKYRRDTPPRTDEDYARIGAFIRELGVSALGVQEICGQQPLDKVAAAIGPTWRAVLGTTGQWSDGLTQQGVGLLYNSAQLQLLHCEELLDFPSERDGVNVFHRKPVTACLRHFGTGADFRIAVVHLKAGRKDRDKQKRRAEAQTLREWVDRLQRDPDEDPDIVILGDFNCTYGDAPEQILEQDGAMQYLDQQRPSPTILWFDTPIDQFAVGRGFAEIRRDSLVAHAVDGEEQRSAFRKTFSDHFPCTVVLDLNGDDDPQATFARGPATQVLPLSRRPKAAATAPSAPAWPPAVGTTVVVYAGEQTYTGELLRSLPREHGWVVIAVDGKPRGFPMQNVRYVRIKD
ncbi:MAG: endonuclease/exonuclease/phosphatase family protein [Planctomycetota bacterium]